MPLDEHFASFREAKQLIWSFNHSADPVRFSLQCATSARPLSTDVLLRVIAIMNLLNMIVPWLGHREWRLGSWWREDCDAGSQLAHPKHSPHIDSCQDQVWLCQQSFPHGLLSQSCVSQLMLCVQYLNADVSSLTEQRSASLSPSKGPRTLTSIGNDFKVLQTVIALTRHAEGRQMHLGIT